MTPTQLKAKVKNISREKEVDPQLVLTELGRSRPSSIGG